MYTNVKGYGGNFLDVVDSEINSASNIAIASGYASYDILNRYKDNFIKIAEEGGSSKLLLGMAFYEGLSSNKLDLLSNLSKSLEKINGNSGVFVTYSGKFHGKMYWFDKSGGEKIYLGSSNFSRSGLSENIECTAEIKDSETQKKAKDFLEFLLNRDNAVSILKADITIPGTTQYTRTIALDNLDDLETYNPETIDKSLYPSFDYPLSRVVEKEKSNLNVYFGKGRLNSQTGYVRPRPWYEVELIANKEIRDSDLYPKGDFLAYTDDGYIIPMYTGGDYYKNIRSRGSLRIFGQWIKGKLQKSGALIPLTPVTQDTLDAYGNDTLSFYKIDDGKYYLEF